MYIFHMLIKYLYTAGPAPPLWKSGGAHTLITVKKWCRNTMTEEQLDAVAMGHVNHERSSSVQEILEVWDCSGHCSVAVAFNE